MEGLGAIAAGELDVSADYRSAEIRPATGHLDWPTDQARFWPDDQDRDSPAGR